MIAFVVCVACVAFILYLDCLEKSHQRDIEEVRAEHHYANMLKLSYREDAGEKLTAYEEMQLKEARVLEASL